MLLSLSSLLLYTSSLLFVNEARYNDNTITTVLANTLLQKLNICTQSMWTARKHNHYRLDRSVELHVHADTNIRSSKMTLTILEQTNQHLVDLEVIIHVSIVNVCNLSTISVSHHRNMWYLTPGTQLWYTYMYMYMTMRAPMEPWLQLCYLTGMLLLHLHSCSTPIYSAPGNYS